MTSVLVRRPCEDIQGRIMYDGDNKKVHIETNEGQGFPAMYIQLGEKHGAL